MGHGDDDNNDDDNDNSDNKNNNNNGNVKEVPKFFARMLLVRYLFS